MQAIEMETHKFGKRENGKEKKKKWNEVENGYEWTLVRKSQ